MTQPHLAKHIVLVLCTGNSCRSQMAEVGINLADARPKNSSAYLGRLPVKHLILVCDRASQTCPRVWPGALTRHSLPFDDPAHATGSDEEILAVFRLVRDEIEQTMNAWTPTQRGGQL